MKKTLTFFFLIAAVFSIQISSFPSKEIAIHSGENTTLSITVVNDRAYSLNCVLTYIGNLDVSLPAPTQLKPYETKTISFTVAVPENYSGDNPSSGYVVVSEKTEGIVSSAILVPITVYIPGVEQKGSSSTALINIAEEIKSSLEKKMENESVVVFPALPIRPLSPQAYLLLTFPKSPRSPNYLVFLALSFLLTSLVLFFIFSEITKEHGRV
jgi:hypothetical protein